MRTVITNLRIEGNGFLQPMEVELSPQLNCLIGARGTGKTSLLELIRYGMGRDPADPERAATLADLIPAALGDTGSVEVTVQTRHGQALKISRSVNANQHQIIDAASGDAVAIEWPPFDRYDVAIFSQNELEEVSINPEARREVLDSFCGQEISRIRDELATMVRRLEVNASRQIQLRNEIESLKSQSELLPQTKAELQAAEADYEQLLSTLQTQETEKKALDGLARQRQALTYELELLRSGVREAAETLEEPYPGRALGQKLGALLSEDSVAKAASRDRLLKLRQDVSVAAAEYRDLRQRMTAKLTEIRDLIDQCREQTDVEYRAVDAQYQGKAAQLGEMSQRWQQVAGRRDALLAQVRALDLVQEQIGQRQATLDELATERQALLNRQSHLRSERFATRQKAAQALNQQIGGSVRVNVMENGDFEVYRQFLMDSLKGSAMWYNRVAGTIAKQVPPLKLAGYARGGDVETFSGVSGLDAERARRVLGVFEESHLNAGVEAIEVEDAVTFELRVADDTYLTSERLSQGQRCTTILSILLVDSQNPLIVDQPEDNLDNAYVVESVVEVIHAQTANRQFIFVTHNPNIPVLGEADKVVAMAALDGRGVIAASGKWDEDEVKDRILTIMEGGAEAFGRRQRAYAKRDPMPA